MKILFKVQNDGKILVNTYGKDIIASVRGGAYTWDEISDGVDDWNVFARVTGDYLEIEIDDNKKLPNPSIWDKRAEDPLYL